MKKGICHVVGAGDFTGEDMEVINKGDTVIACDGGFAALQKYGIPCNVCIGDFDSLGYVPKLEGVIKLPQKKDVTDMEAGIRVGLEMGYEKFRLYGALGASRLSHTVANIQTALGLAGRGMDCRIIDEKCVVVPMCDEEREFENRGYSYVSIFAMNGIARVELRGFEYGEEKEIDLRPDYPLGVSNEFKGERGSIKVSGKIIIIFEKNSKTY